MSSDVSTVALDSAPEQKGEEDSLTSPQADALVNEEVSLDTAAESAEPVEGGVGVCQFFLKGKCRFGHRCRLSHSIPTLDEASVVLLNQEGVKNGENEGKHKKRKSKDYSAAKPKESEENVSAGSNKKPRMRTAEEVIHRILWDPSVQGSEFVVGYVDRFLGVLERPFSEFNWDANPCDWDNTTAAELALPQHRIQYFIHRGRRVWDRNSRTDRVFGSTGQPLAPPFGGEEEVEGPSIHHDLDQCSSAGTIPPEEGQQKSDANIHPPDSTPPAPNDTESAPQGHQEAEREETAKRLETLTDRMSLSQREREVGESNGVRGSLEDCNESCEDKTEEEQSPSGKSPGADQRGKAGRGSRPPKRRPTHFVGFRADTPSILSAFQKLREELTALLPAAAAQLWRPASKLHITLCLLTLPGPAEVAAAADVLRRFAEWDRNPPVAVTLPVKPKHFYGKVLYLSPQPQNLLQQLNAGLQEAFRKEGWLHRDSFNPRYHLTLAKVEKQGRERLFEGVGDLKVGKSLNFGRLPVNTLHLCAMGMTVADGFYHTLCSVSLR